MAKNTKTKIAYDGIPEAWWPARTARANFIRKGDEFIDSIIEFSHTLSLLREELRAPGNHSGQGWQDGCKAYLGMSHKTAARWIDTGRHVRLIRDIANGDLIEIPSELIGDTASPTDTVSIDDHLRDQAQLRLASVCEGDCTPHRIWPAFLGGMLGGNGNGEGDPAALPNPTGRATPDPVKQLELDLDGLRKHGTAFSEAWSRWETAQKLKAKQGVRDFISNLPPELKAEARDWLNSAK